LQEWQKILSGNPDFESFAVVNPPGQGVVGMQIAMTLLQGKKLKDGLLAGAAGNTFYLPAPGQVDKSSLGQYYNQAKSKAALYFLDSVMSQTEIDALFK
jgi:ribose transport system substrate-binding protein